MTVCLLVTSLFLIGCGSEKPLEPEAKQDSSSIEPIPVSTTTNSELDSSSSNALLSEPVGNLEKGQITPQKSEQVETEITSIAVSETNTTISISEPTTDESTATESIETEIKLSEEISNQSSVQTPSVPSIRSSNRERFEEESRLELRENRWYVIGESEPYTGRVKRWVIEGWKQAEGSYKNGLQEGRWKMWWDNGLLRSAVYMKNGNPDGEAIYWYSNGQRKEEGSWSNGKFTATAKWSEAGEEISLK